jgi:chaperone required for assembly of F1-ATPase
MRELFDDVFGNEPLDPMESARRNMRPNLRKRFYERAAVGKGAPYPVLLDDRVVKTPAGSTLAAPSALLAQAIAAEWNAQGERINPATMPLTKLANTIIDGVAPNPDPVLSWAREAHGARFVLGEGVIFVTQPEHAIASVRAAIPSDPWRLGAVHLITTLTGSALIALAVAARQLGVEEAWAAAHVDEDWNMKLWGRDEIALARRVARFADMQAAATVLLTK